MIRLKVTRPDGELLWKSDMREATLALDGTLTLPAALPIMPPYSIEVAEEDEPDGSSA